MVAAKQRWSKRFPKKLRSYATEISFNSSAKILQIQIRVWNAAIHVCEAWKKIKEDLKSLICDTTEGQCQCHGLKN